MILYLRVNLIFFFTINKCIWSWKCSYHLMVYFRLGWLTVLSSRNMVEHELYFRLTGPGWCWRRQTHTWLGCCAIWIRWNSTNSYFYVTWETDVYDEEHLQGRTWTYFIVHTTVYFIYNAALNATPTTNEHVGVHAVLEPVPYFPKCE